MPLFPEQTRRHRAFLAREPATRPLAGCWLFPYDVRSQFPRTASRLPEGILSPDDIPADSFLEDLERLLAAYTELDDDYPLSAGAFYAVPWMEAIMGCSIHFTGGAMWAEPCIAEWEAWTGEPPDLYSSPWFAKLLELLAALVDRGGGRYWPSPTVMRGVADVCAAMRSPSALAVDVSERPEELARLAGFCAQTWLAVAEEQLRLIPESADGYFVGSGGMRYWTPDKGVWLQDDALAILSPRSYRELFLPHVRRIASRFTTAFHLHGTRLWPVEMLLEVEEIDVLQLSSDDGVDKVFPAWKKIAARKPCIAFVHAGSGGLHTWRRVLAELPPSGLSLQTVAASVGEARELRDLVFAAQAGPPPSL